MDVGLELRQARERRGLSLQQLSNTTKISPRVLQAIEAADEDRLPAPVFTRSFVRTYAREVSLDPDDTMRRYFEQFTPPAAVVTVEPGAAPVIAASTPDEPRWSPADAIRGRFGTAAVLTVVALLAIFLGTRNHTRAKSAATQAAAPAVVSTTGAPSTPPAQAAPVATSGTAAAPPASLHLAIATTGPCWVQATVNGAPVLAKLLGAGDKRDVDTTSDVRLRIGDPSAFTFSINGAPAAIRGPAGQPITVRVTKDNFRQFLTR